MAVAFHCAVKDAFPVLERHATDHRILPPSSLNFSPCSSNLFPPLPRSVRVPRSSSLCSLACSSSSSLPGCQVRLFDPGVTLLCLPSPSTYLQRKSPLPSSFHCVRLPFGLSVRYFNFACVVALIEAFLTRPTASVALPCHGHRSLLARYSFPSSYAISITM